MQLLPLLYIVDGTTCNYVKFKMNCNISTTPVEGSVEGKLVLNSLF